MARTVADATRFTVNAPHAYTNPTSLRAAITSIPQPSSAAAPPNSRARAPQTSPSRPNPAHPPKPLRPAETPSEKVARLRAARLTNKYLQVSRWDRVVVRGRVWADRAHRITLLGIIGFSVVAGAVTVFALTDMIIHNRRKRNAFFAEQHNIYGARLMEAIKAEKAGLELDDEQVLILDRERVKVLAEEAEERRTLRSRVRGFLFGGLSEEEQVQNVGGVPTEGQVLEVLGIDQKRVLDKADGMDAASRQEAKRVGTGILEAVKESRREGERLLEDRGARGGPLDQMAEDAAEKVREKEKGGWLNWGG